MNKCLLRYEIFTSEYTILGGHWPPVDDHIVVSSRNYNFFSLVANDALTSVWRTSAHDNLSDFRTHVYVTYGRDSYSLPFCCSYDPLS